MRNVLHWVNLWRMGILWTAALFFSHFKLLLEKLFGAHERIQQGIFDTRLSPCACIITGASSGIGRATAEVLALKGYYVILAGQSMTRLCKVVEELELYQKNITVKALEVDLASTVSILKFSKAVEQLLDTSHISISLQLLINNAGKLATTKSVTSEDYDSMIATNYLGHFLLTQLLLPQMRRSKVPARIVNVGSFTHHCVQSFDGLLSLLQKRDMQQKSDLYKGLVYRIAYIYETSKLFMIMFTYELHRRLNVGHSTQVTAIAADPGIVRSNIFREVPSWFSSCIFTCLRCTWLLHTPSNGCRPVVDAALASPTASGKYFFGGDGHVLKSSALSYNKEFAADLWDLSWRLCQESMPENELLLSEASSTE